MPPPELPPEEEPPEEPEPPPEEVPPPEEEEPVEEVPFPFPLEEAEELELSEELEELSLLSELLEDSSSCPLLVCASPSALSEEELSLSSERMTPPSADKIILISLTANTLDASRLIHRKIIASRFNHIVFS